MQIETDASLRERIRRSAYFRSRPNMPTLLLAYGDKLDTLATRHGVSRIRLPDIETESTGE